MYCVLQESVLGLMWGLVKDGGYYGVLHEAHILKSPYFVTSSSS